MAAAPAELDLVQLRWQQIRSFEASQATAQENYELKAQLLQLKSQQRETDRKNKLALQGLGHIIKTWIMRTRTDMNNLKSASLADLAEAMLVKDSVRNALRQMKMQGLSHDSEMDFLQQEQRRLMTELEQSNEAVQAATRSKIAESDRHHASLERLRVQLAEADSHRANLLQTIEEHESARAIQQQRYDALYRQCEGLVVTIQKLEGDNASTLAFAREAEQRLLADHEHQVDGLNNEISRLHLRIAEQEEQIDRLTAALMGNKSHFQKFVELKQENISLHSELKHISSKAVTAQLLVPPQGAQAGANGRRGRARRQAGGGGGNRQQDSSPSPGGSLDGGPSVGDNSTVGSASVSGHTWATAGGQSLGTKQQQQQQLQRRRNEESIGHSIGGGNSSRSDLSAATMHHAAPAPTPALQGLPQRVIGAGPRAAMGRSAAVGAAPHDSYTESLLAGKGMRIARGTAAAAAAAARSHSPVRNDEDSNSVNSEMTSITAQQQQQQRQQQQQQQHLLFPPRSGYLSSSGSAALRVALPREQPAVDLTQFSDDTPRDLTMFSPPSIGAAGSATTEHPVASGNESQAHQDRSQAQMRTTVGSFGSASLAKPSTPSGLSLSVRGEVYGSSSPGTGSPSLSKDRKGLGTPGSAGSAAASFAFPGKAGDDRGGAGGLPLAVPLLSKETRAGLANRKGGTAVSQIDVE